MIQKRRKRYNEHDETISCKAALALQAMFGQRFWQDQGSIMKSIFQLDYQLKLLLSERAPFIFECDTLTKPKIELNLCKKTATEPGKQLPLFNRMTIFF
jgi:hypothetical protein